MSSLLPIREKTLRLEADPFVREHYTPEECARVARIAQLATDEQERRRVLAAKGGPVGPRLDVALFAELELERTSKPVQRAVRTKAQKERGRRHAEKRHAQELDEARVEWLHEKRAEWLRVQSTIPRPASAAQPTIADACKAIPFSMAVKEVTLNELGANSKLSFTEREHKLAQRARQRREVDEVKMRSDLHDMQLKTMSEDDRAVVMQIKQKVTDLQIRWHMADPPIDHEKRRQLRVSEADQRVRYQSRWWHARSKDFYELGIPVTTAGGQVVPTMRTDDPTKYLLDADGVKVPRRLKAGQKFYFDIIVPPESFMEHTFNWRPAHDVRMYTEDYAQKQLALHEAKSYDPRTTQLERAYGEEALNLLRGLVRDLKACDPNEDFVYRLTVHCDPVAPNLPSNSPYAGAVRYGNGTCAREAQLDPKRIANEGPLKVPSRMCSHCQGYIIAKPSLIKKCQHCAELEFCSKPCKAKHIARAHPETALAVKVAKRRRALGAKKRMKRERNLRREISLAREEERARQEDERMEVGPSYGFEVPPGMFDEEEEEEVWQAVEVEDEEERND